MSETVPSSTPTVALNTVAPATAPPAMLANRSTTGVKRKLVPGLILLASFAAVGYFTGWVTGASRVPAASALLPVGVGLLGAVAYSVVEKKSAMDKVVESIKKMKDDAKSDGPTLDRLRESLGSDGDSSLWLPAFWALGATVFCLMSYWGIQEGINFRVPAYQPLDALVATAPGVTPKEWGILNELYWYLRAAGVPKTEMESLFSKTVVPVLNTKTEHGDKRNADELTKVVDRILKTSASPIYTASNQIPPFIPLVPGG
jgi:hypothetical protein